MPSDALLTIQLHQAEKSVIAHPGRTVSELAMLIRADRKTLAGCLDALADAGTVHKSELVRCTLTRELAHNWRPGPDPLSTSAATAA